MRFTQCSSKPLVARVFNPCLARRTRVEHPCHIRHGFILFELMVVLLLAGVFLAVASKLFVSTIQLNQQAAQVHTDASRLDAAIRTMRRDVWAASDASLRDGALVLKRSDDGHEIAWKIEKDRAFVRSEAGTEQRWALETAGAKLDVHGAEVIVQIPDTKVARGG